MRQRPHSAAAVLGSQRLRGVFDDGAVVSLRQFEEPFVVGWDSSNVNVKEGPDVGVPFQHGFD